MSPGQCSLRTKTATTTRSAARRADARPKRSTNCTSSITSQPRKGPPSHARQDRGSHPGLSSLTCENPTGPSSPHGTVVTGSQEVRGFESLRLTPSPPPVVGITTSSLFRGSISLAFGNQGKWPCSNPCVLAASEQVGAVAVRASLTDWYPTEGLAAEV